MPIRGGRCARMSSLLAEDGIVLVCMPNQEHWSFAERLLRGTWDYEAQGLFDRTHIRWFSRETTRRLLRQSGLAPLDVIPRVFDAEAAEAFAEAMAPALRRLGIDVPAYRERAAPLQHVWRAARRAPQRLPVVSTMLGPGRRRQPCARHRADAGAGGGADAAHARDQSRRCRVRCRMTRPASSSFTARCWPARQGWRACARCWRAAGWCCASSTTTPTTSRCCSAPTC